MDNDTEGSSTFEPAQASAMSFSTEVLPPNKGSMLMIYESDIETLDTQCREEKRWSNIASGFFFLALACPEHALTPNTSRL